MPEETSDQPERRSVVNVLFDRRWKKVTAAVLIFVVAALILIPYGIRYGVKRAILANGGDAARIEDIDFNPFTGRLALTALDVTVDEERHLTVSEAELRLSWWPLFKKRIQINGIHLSDAEVTVVALQEGRWRLGGVTAQMLSGPEKEDGTSAWEFGLKTVTVENTRIDFRMPDFRGTLQVDKWEVERVFSWHPDEMARVSFAGKLNGSPLGFSGELTPFAEDRRGSFNLQAESLALKPFEKLLGASVRTVSGTVGVDSEIKMVQKADGNLQLAHEGRIRLADIRLQTPAAEASTGKLTYEGNLDIDMPASGTTRVSANGNLTGDQLATGSEAFSAELASLSWRGPVSLSLEEAARRIDAEGALQMKGIDAAAGENRFGEDRLDWDGVLKAEFSADGDIQTQADGSLESEKMSLTLSGAKLNAGHGGFSWKGQLKSRQSPEATGVEMEGEFALQNAEVTSDTFELKEAKLDWKGSVTCDLPKAEKGMTLRTDGRLESGPLDVVMPGTEARAGKESLQWEGKLDYLQTETTGRINMDGSLEAATVSFDSPDAGISEQRLQWNGKLSVYLPQPEGNPAMELDGRLNLGELQLALPGNQLSVRQDSLAWEGPLIYGKVAEPAVAKTGGTLQLRQLEVTDTDERYLILASSEITAEALRLIETSGVSGKILTVGGLQVFNPQRDKAANALVRAERVSVQDYTVDPQKELKFEAVSADSLKSFVARNADGNWSFTEGLALLSGPEKEKPAESRQAPAARKPRPQISLGKFDVRGDSGIQFVDRSITPAYDTRVTLQTLQLSGLDSTDSGQKSPFALAGKIGKYTDIKFDGTLQPFAERLSMDLEGSIEDLSLPPLSPYIVNAIGYKFASGQADARIEMTIQSGEMDGDTRFVFEQLKTKAVDPETLKKLDVEQTIPMETALSLLRDGDGTIKLRVPVSGDISNPKFSFNDAINQALVKATTKATMSYLKYALGPYGIAIAAAELAYKTASKAAAIRLEPLKFEAGQASLDATGQDYVDRLARILKDRPEARIRVCGLAVEAADKAALLAQNQAAAEASGETAEKSTADEAEEKVDESPEDEGPQVTPEQLQALAEARAGVIKDTLVESYGIEDDRILLCHPEIDKSGDGQPRAEILF